MNDKKSTTSLPTMVGPYKILESLGQGGMGEVFLALDPIFERKVALKRIRPDLQENQTIRSRFLREAKVASLLTHPSIVPILTMKIEPPNIYYTMPYVEGETLRQILKKTKEQEKAGEELHPIGRSIPTLSRIFLQVCEAIAYTHSKGILHRDLKPENIIIGKYGEVMILDWGIADFIGKITKDEGRSELEKEKIPRKRVHEDLTRPGKITGTLAYMAPERIKGGPNSIQTDLYALGVILYQILALQLPFQRKTISSFRKTVDSEEIIGPIESAPYREIPHQLAAIAMKCLSKEPMERFQSVEELIDELKKSIEGRPEWILVGELNLKEKEEWLFQENVLLAKHLAITHNLDVTQWAALSISKLEFENNLRLDAKVKLLPKSEGIGFLLNVPSPGEKASLEEGYLLWIGSENCPSCQLFRNNVQVLEAPKIYLPTNEWRRVRIEKIDDHLKFYLSSSNLDRWQGEKPNAKIDSPSCFGLDGGLKLSFVSHLPLTGKHVGILVKDDRFEIQSCKVYDKSHNVMVGCMAVPNAFLSHRLFGIALEEYRRIAQCFPGRAEGREALFRAGLTLLEQAKEEENRKTRDELFHLALKEFEKLYRTPGAPLEYLGKSLIYQAMNEPEEEAKCLELALRKFPRHPLLAVLKEQIIYRMHESSLNNREAAYRIILLAIRHIPDLLNHPDTKHLIESLKENWEALPFIEGPADSLIEIAIQLAFWLAKVPILVEIAKSISGSNEIALSNALYALLELEATDEVKKLLAEVDLSAERRKSIEIALLEPNVGSIQRALEAKTEIRTFYHLLRNTLRLGPPSLVRQTIETHFKKKTAEFAALELWSLLLEKKWAEAETLIKKWKKKFLTEENSPLHFPYGCWLYIQKGEMAALSHFSKALDTPYPATFALPSHFLTGRINEKEGWIERAFWWEKKELYRQIDLFYKIIGKTNGKTKNHSF